MESTIKISVIIPTFNAATFLSQTIDNILFQSYKNLEIIIVDDGSTDDTAQLARQYPVKFIQQANQGVSAARNAGMNAALGEYLHFMDADDLISLNFYEKMLEAIISVDADMACTGYVHERLPAFNSIVSEKLLYVNADDKLTFTNAFHQGQVWKYLFRTSFLRATKLSFDLTLINAQDKVFAVQAVYFANRIVAVPGTTYFYKERNNSLITSASKKKKELRKQCIVRADEFCRKFAETHNIKSLSAPSYKVMKYKLFGVPLLVRRLYNTGRVRWYLLGVFFLQRHHVA